VIDRSVDNARRAADMHNNLVVSMAALCCARMDILRAEPVLQAAYEHGVVRERPGPGAVRPLVTWAGSGVCPQVQGLTAWLAGLGAGVCLA
jgi:hypothetical protein